MSKYLSKFTEEIVADIKSLIKSVSDNHLKADILSDYLEPKGFREIGLGTNIIVYDHKSDYKKGKPSVVYKIALDEFGIENNYDDVGLSEAIPMFAQVYEVRDDGLISVQEYCKAFKRVEEIQKHYKEIFKTLEKLSKDYLIIDLSPDNIKNYGIDSNGKLRIIDGSDLIPLKETQELCCKAVLVGKKDRKHKCGHKLRYDDRFKFLVCASCGQEYNPVEFRKKFKEVNILKDKHFETGLDEDDEAVIAEFLSKSRTDGAMQTLIEVVERETMYVVDEVDESLGDDSEEDSDEEDEEDDTSETHDEHIFAGVTVTTEKKTYVSADTVRGSAHDDALYTPVRHQYNDIGPNADDLRRAASLAYHDHMNGITEAGMTNPVKVEGQNLTNSMTAGEYSKSKPTTGLAYPYSLLGNKPESPEAPTMREVMHARYQSNLPKNTDIDDDEEDDDEPVVPTMGPARVEKIKPRPLGGNISIGDDDEDDCTAVDLSVSRNPSKRDKYPAKKKKKK